MAHIRRLSNTIEDPLLNEYASIRFKKIDRAEWLFQICTSHQDEIRCSEASYSQKDEILSRR
jgi:hypothetical protein